MLSMVPGQKRKRGSEFFPFSREPYTHWGAFVVGNKRGGYLDNKRGGYLDNKKRSYYDNAYGRLKQLALALSDSRPSSYLDVST